MDALEDLVRLCVELDRHRRADTPDTTAAWKALERAVIGKAVDLLSGPGGLASFLRRRQLGARFGQTLSSAMVFDFEAGGLEALRSGGFLQSE